MSTTTVVSDIWYPVSATPSQPLVCDECGGPFHGTRYTLRDNNRIITCSAICAVAYFYLGERT